MSSVRTRWRRRRGAALLTLAGPKRLKPGESEPIAQVGAGRGDLNGPVTPDQITLVEETMAVVSLDDLARDFYRRAFAADPVLAEMFTADSVVELVVRERVDGDRRLCRVSSTDSWPTGGRWACVITGYGVQAAHYRLMGDALLCALAAALGDRWNDEVAEAWRLAYNLTAETMMDGRDGRGRSLAEVRRLGQRLRRPALGRARPGDAELRIHVLQVVVDRPHRQEQTVRDLLGRLASAAGR